MKIPSKLESGFVNSKDVYHRDGAALLKAIATELGLSKGSFKVTSNRAGDAVYGNVTLHTEGLYVTLCCDGYPEPYGEETSEVKVLFRTCKGLKDYVGGSNRWTTLRKIVEDPQSFVGTLKAMQMRASA